MLKYGQRYVDKGAAHDEQRNRLQQIEFLRKKAAQLGLPAHTNPGLNLTAKKFLRRLSTTSSVVVDRSTRKAVMLVWGCQKRGVVRKVTGRLIRLPASLEDWGVRITHHGR
jgi:hypothetical protein